MTKYHFRILPSKTTKLIELIYKFANNDNNFKFDAATEQWCGDFNRKTSLSPPSAWPKARALRVTIGRYFNNDGTEPFVEVPTRLIGKLSQKLTDKLNIDMKKSGTPLSVSFKGLDMETKNDSPIKVITKAPSGTIEETKKSKIKVITENYQICKPDIGIKLTPNVKYHFNPSRINHFLNEMLDFAKDRKWMEYDEGRKKWCGKFVHKSSYTYMSPTSIEYALADEFKKYFGWNLKYIPQKDLNMLIEKLVNKLNERSQNKDADLEITFKGVDIKQGTLSENEIKNKSVDKKIVSHEYFLCKSFKNEDKTLQDIAAKIKMWK